MTPSRNFWFSFALVLVGAAPASADCPLSVSGMSTQLYLPTTGERVYCVYEDRRYELDVYGPSNNLAYCIEPVGSNQEPRSPVGFDPTASCLDASYGDRQDWRIDTLASVPASGIQGGLSPYGCAGENYTLEYVFSYDKCPPTACTPPPDDLKAWFPLDETSGTTVRDIKGVLAGTRYGASIVSGRVGKALDFDGVNDYVSIPDSTPYYTMAISDRDFSIDAWIQTTKSNGIIVAKRDSNYAGYIFMVYAGRPLLQMGDSSYYQNFLAPSSVRVDDGSWHFVAVTVDRDSSTGGKMYVDGNLVYTFNPLNFRYRSLLNSVPLRLGQTAQGDTYAIYDGKIDEVEIFGRALAESELDAIWAAGSNGKCKVTPSICGNNVCESTKGESCSTCATDCGSCPSPPCDGDGICEAHESPTCFDCCWPSLDAEGLEERADDGSSLKICPQRLHPGSKDEQVQGFTSEDQLDDVGYACSAAESNPWNVWLLVLIMLMTSRIRWWRKT